MTKEYHLILDDGVQITIAADSHHAGRSTLTLSCMRSTFTLYRVGADGQNECIASYVGLKGWQIVEKESDPG